MEVEALLCLTETVIRSHKLTEYNKRGGLIMLFQSSASKAKSDIDRYYGTCMSHNFSLKNQF